VEIVNFGMGINVNWRRKFSMKPRMFDEVIDDVPTFDEMIHDIPVKRPLKAGDVVDDSILAPVEIPESCVSIYDYFQIVPKAESLVDVVVGNDAKEGRKGLTPEQRIFITHYMASGVVTTALKKAGISRRRYNEMLEHDKIFREAVLNATEAIVDELEHTALKEAKNGNTKVLIKLLESYKPQKFGRVSTIQNLVDGKVDINIKSWAELVEKAEREVIDVTPVLADAVEDEK
jgi:phage terminase small subunit